MNDDQKTQVIEKVSDENNRFNPSIWSSTLGVQAPVDFYRRVKRFRLIGYFTFAQIHKNILAYDPIPGDFDGCIPLNPEDNVWTL